MRASRWRPKNIATTLRVGRCSYREAAGRRVWRSVGARSASLFDSMMRSMRSRLGSPTEVFPTSIGIIGRGQTI